MKKKKVCICGNCISYAIYRHLKTNRDYKKLYDTVVLKHIFAVGADDVAEYIKNISECDVFLTQDITGEKFVKLGVDTISLKKHMKPGAKLIKFPVPYFRGYFPEQFYLHDAENQMVGECPGLPSPYHNSIILYGYIHKLSESDVLEIINKSVNLKNIKKIAKESINELKRREQKLDCKISTFIEQNYQKHRLFWTINHPTNIVLRHISEQILQLLGIKKHWYNFSGLAKRVKKECVDIYKTPIINSVKGELNLLFYDKNIKYDIDFINLAYKYYDKHPDLVTLNAHITENIL